MTHARIELTIELRPTGGHGDRGGFATVDADRIALDDDTLTAYRDDAAVARYPFESVAALHFGAPTAAALRTGTARPAGVALPAGATGSSTAATVAGIAENVRPEGAGELAAGGRGDAQALDGAIAPTEPSASGARWTPGEDALLRTLSDQHAGLTMMIIKTRRPVDEVLDRLRELGIDHAMN